MTSSAAAESSIDKMQTTRRGSDQTWEFSELSSRNPYYPRKQTTPPSLGWICANKLTIRPIKGWRVGLWTAESRGETKELENKTNARGYKGTPTTLCRETWNGAHSDSGADDSGPRLLPLHSHGCIILSFTQGNVHQLREKEILTRMLQNVWIYFWKPIRHNCYRPFNEQGTSRIRQTAKQYVKKTINKNHAQLVCSSKS